MKSNIKQIRMKCFREKHMQPALCLVIFLLFFVSFLTQSFQTTRDIQRKELYGYHNGGAFFISDEAASALQAHQAIRSFGKMVVYGSVLQEDCTPAGFIGTVDADFRNMEHLQLLDGNFPENPYEIAVEAATLDLLGISYQSGQEIVIPVQLENGVICEKTYRLCGILKTYTTNWKSEGAALCSAVVAEPIGTAICQHLFFIGDYGSEEQMKELEEIVCTSSHAFLVYNDYSYPSPRTSLVQLVEQGAVIFAIAMFCILFLVCLQISGYRKQAYRVRILALLGADRKETERTLLQQAFSQWQMCSAFSLLICSGVCIPLSFFCSSGNFQFKLTAIPYVVAVTVSLFTTLTGKTVQILMLRKVSLLPKGKDLTRYETNHLTWRNTSKPFNFKNFCKIQHRRNRKYFRIECILLTFSILTLFICLYGICDTYRDYKFYSTVVGQDYLWTSVNPAIGLKREQITRLKNTANIDVVLYSSNVSSDSSRSVSLTYDGWEKDVYQSMISETADGSMETDGLSIHIVVVPEESVMWDYYIPEGIDERAFMEGEAVILYFPEIARSENASYVYVNTVGRTNTGLAAETYLPDIDLGDVVTLKILERSYSVRCAYLMQQFPNEIQTAIDFLLPGTVLVSEKLYMTLFDLNEPCYNYVAAFGNAKLSYEVNDLIASSIAGNQGIRFENNRIKKADLQKQLKTDIIALGSISLLVCVFSLMIIYRNRVFLYETEQERMRLLKCLGCEPHMLSSCYREYLGAKFSFFLILFCTTLVFAYKFLTSSFRTLPFFSDRVSMFFSFDLYMFPLWVMFLLPTVYWSVYLGLLRITGPCSKDRT